MSEPIKNRYEFVLLFDVENGNRMAILIWATCLVSIRRPDMGS